MRILTNHQVSKSKGDSKKSKTANTQKTAKKGKSSAHSSPNARIIIGIALMLFAALSSISIFSYTFTHGADILYIGGNADKPANWLGKMGAYLAHGIADYSFGIYAIGLMLILFFVGVKLTFDKEPITLFKSKDSEHPAKGLGLIINTFLTISWLSMFTALFSPNSENFPEGVFGEIITGALVSGTTKFGAVCILIAILFVILILCYNLSPNSVIEFFSKFKKENSDPEGEKVKKHRGFFSFFRKKEDDDEDEQAVYDERENEELPELYAGERGSVSKKYDNNTIVFEPTQELEPEPIESPIKTAKQPQKPQKPTPKFEPVVPLDIINENNNVTKPVEAGSAEEEDSDGTPPAEPKTSGVPIEELEDYDPRKDLSTFKFPTTDLLMDYQNAEIDEETKRKDLYEKKERIERTLKSFGIEIKKIFAKVGPTVTLYEIVPADGVRISKIKNLEDDIALSLAALGIRIIAPIPGKGTIGIEVPNANPQIVPMKELLESEAFKNSKYELPVALGKTISNESFVADLAKMPHLLMAGATGQGKSVGLNAIIASLLYKKHPAELKFVLVDPKKVEFTLYSIIENHYLAMLPNATEPIITDTKKVINTLNSLCNEMDTRYDLLKTASVRNIKEYNAKFCHRQLSPANGHRYLPYIVLIIDEFGDLIMTAGREIETPIARLAQLARAIGIHLVIATQRPSVKIITGAIKANFPARVAFRVASQIDSRTILDSSGADQLIGRGDMLISTGSDLVRLQCAFIDTPEVEKLTRFIADQQGYPEPFLLPEYVEEETDNLDANVDSDAIDPCFMDAATLIVETQQGSTSLIQRRMRLGYARAGRIMDQLEEFKIVGPSMGSKVREVKVRSNEELRVIFQNMGLI